MVEGWHSKMKSHVLSDRSSSLTCWTRCLLSCLFSCKKTLKNCSKIWAKWCRWCCNDTMSAPFLDVRPRPLATGWFAVTVGSGVKMGLWRIPGHSAGDSALLPGLSPWHGMNSWTNSDKNNDMTSKRVLNDPDFWVRYTDILLYFRKWFWRSTWQGAWTSYDVLRTSNGHPRIFISGFDPSWDIVAKPPALRGVAEIRGGAAGLQTDHVAENDNPRARRLASALRSHPLSINFWRTNGALASELSCHRGPYRKGTRCKFAYLFDAIHQGILFAIPDLNILLLCYQGRLGREMTRKKYLTLYQSVWGTYDQQLSIQLL